MSDEIHPPLRPCPFCGDTMDSFAGMTEGAFAQGSEGTFSVNCDCGAMGPSASSMDEAVVFWNRRLKPENRAATVVENEAETAFAWYENGIYDGTDCSKCGRERVMICDAPDGAQRRVCEKCGWDQAADEYASILKSSSPHALPAVSKD